MTGTTTVLVTSPAGETAGALALPAEIFDVQANVPLMHQVVVAQLAAARQGTHSTKTRGDVSGGGSKPYRQKGTGRARQGSTRAPQFAGGGVAHGPVPHGYAQRTPKKMKAAALRGALSDRARSGNVHVLSAIVDGDAPSTKAAATTLAAVSTARNVLVVVGREDEAGWKSLRNVPSVHLLSSDQLNTYDVLVSDDVVFTRAALDEFCEFSRAEAATEVEVPAEAGAAAKARSDERATKAAEKAAAKADRDAAKAAREAAEEAARREAEEAARREAEEAQADQAGDEVTGDEVAEDLVTDEHAQEAVAAEGAVAEEPVTDTGDEVAEDADAEDAADAVTDGTVDAEDGDAATAETGTVSEGADAAETGGAAEGAAGSEDVATDETADAAAEAGADPTDEEESK